MSRKFTILHTEASDGWGGQEIRILSESGWLRARGHEVIIAAGKKSRLLEKASSEGFPAFGLEFSGRSLPGDLLRLIGIINRTKPDVVATHSSLDSWAGLIAARICGFPRTIRYRHISIPVKGNLANRWQYTRLTDHVITTADFITTALRTKFDLPESKISTIPTGVGRPENLIGRGEAHRALCAELGVPERSRFIGCVAVLRSWKGHTLLMGAMERLAAAHPDLHLVLVGDGPERRYLCEQRLERRCFERIHIIGHRDDPWPYFRAFDAAVLPSTKAEGIPQSLLQAMMAGCPVIGSRVGGIPEIVSHGQTGLLVSPDDELDLGKAIEFVLSHGREAALLASNAKKLAEEKYSLESMGCKVVNLMEQIMNRT
jgi:glycosyltransferase involved in cell wall biosynthesis